MKNLFLWLCAGCLAGSPILHAQSPAADSARSSFRLYGHVTDGQTQTALPGTTIQIAGLSRGAISDKNGIFSIDHLPEGEYTLIAHFIGYTEFRKHIRLTKDLEQVIILQPSILQSQQIVVTGQRKTHNDDATQQTTVLTMAQIDEHRGQTLGENLKDIPGVTLLQTGPSISKPVIRGLHSQRILLLNAGVQQEGQQWGAEHAPEIDPFAPAQIEVLKGAAGVEYGAGAIGGVIRIEPRPLPTDDSIGGIATLNGFSNNGQGAASLLLEGGGLFEGFGWRAQTSARQAGDSRAADYVIGNSGFKELNASVSFGYHGASTGIEAYFSHFGTELGIFRGSHIGNLHDLERAIANGRPFADYTFGYDIRSPRQQITHDLWSVHAQYSLENIGLFELQYGWQQNNRSEYDAHNLRLTNPSEINNAPPAMELALTTYSLDLKFRHHPTDGFSGTLGVSGMTQGNVRSGRVYLIPNFRSYTGGLYALENYSTGNWIFNAGTRFDYRRIHVVALERKDIPDTIQTFASITGAVGALWEFSPEWFLTLNLGSAWRPPLVNEQFSNDVHHGTAQFEIGDPTLQSERSNSADLALRYSSERIHLEIGTYYNLMDNFIMLFPDVTNPTITIRGTFPTFRYRQVQARLYGFDGSFEYQLTDMLRLGANVSVVRGDDRSHDEPLISMPSDRVRFVAHFHLPEFAGMEAPYFEAASTLVRRQDRFPAHADYADPPPGYVLFDATVGAGIPLFSHTLRCNLSVQNLFNTSYRDYMSRFRYFTDDPGRNIILRLTLPFGKQREA